MLQNLAQKMTGRQTESVLKATDSWSSHSVLWFSLHTSIYIHFSNNKSNIIKFKKVPLLPKDTSANRFESTLQNVMHLTRVCTHTQSHSEPQYTHSCTFHVLLNLGSLHISTFTLFFITAARLSIHYSTSRAKHTKTYLHLLSRG